MSRGKIILVLIVIYFSVFAVINVNKEKDINKEILEKVVFVKDGKFSKKNNNKIVVVSGKIKYDKLVTFDELENFKTIKINRKVEDFIKYHKDGSSKDEYKWQERTEVLENESDDFLKQIVSEEKISNINIGDYQLDQKGLDLIPINKYYTDQESIENLTTKGISYTRDPWEEDLQEGDIKLTYKYYDLKKHPYISILAVQKDNSFIPYKVNKKKEIYQLFTKKISTKKQLSKELDNNVKNTKKGKLYFILMIICIGVFFIVDNKSNKKSKI